MKSKECKKCKVVKPFEDFYQHKRAKDGMTWWCKECHLACNRLWRIKNPEAKKKMDNDWRVRNPDHKRKLDRLWRAKNREKIRDIGIKYYNNHRDKHLKRFHEYRESYPERNKAQNTINNALRDGKINKPPVCEICKNVPHRIEGHHPDYNNPSKVIWLCTSCHTLVHLYKHCPSVKGIFIETYV